jgi:hypothetical protein
LENDKQADEEREDAGAVDDVRAGEDLPEICPNCMTGNARGAHMCRSCFAPLSSHAAIDPIMSIAARGDTFWKASSNPRKPIIVIGIFLLFGPTFLISGTLFISTLFGGLRAAGDLIGLILCAFFAFISGGILFKTVGNLSQQTTAVEEGGFPVKEEQGEDDELTREAEAAVDEGD